MNLNKVFRINLVWFLNFLFIGSLGAQDLSLVSQDKSPFKINGSLSANQIFYGVTGIESRRDPYNYFLSGNVNMSLYGLSVPFSYTFSNQQSQFRQPFNQFGIQPSYKWARGYLGYNNMVFSPYSLNGHLFLGGGVELNPPGIFRFSAMYGRLQKAVEADSSNINNFPMFQRIGYGMKVGVGKGNDFIDFILFRAKDQENSLAIVPEEYDVLPSENLVLGVNVSKAISKRIIFTSEYSNSAFTRDVRSIETDGGPRVFKMVGPLFTQRASSSYYNAFRTNVNYNGKGYSFGLGYERIDPNYRTLGAYYFNNDLENITFNTSKRFWEGKMNIAANIGTQRNNLNDQKISTMRRFIGALNVNIAPSPKWNISGSYSNFQTFTRIRSQFERINQLTPYENLDTLNFVQLTQSASLNTSYLIGNPQDQNKRQHLNVGLTYQVAGDARGDRRVQVGTKFYNGNFAYNYLIIPINLNITTALNGNYSRLDDNSTLLIGPTLAVNKSFFENKFRSGISTSWNKGYTNREGGTRIMNVRIFGNYIFKKRHNFNISTIILNRNKYLRTPAFTEFTGTLGYTFNF